ncbi:MAG: T9SS type A sorting domain-containing protein, partial [Bacteroidota bacterium]
EEVNYIFYHEEPSVGPNYYRLKQVDLDGTAELSEVRIVEFDNDQNLGLYPNPAGTELYITNQEVLSFESAIIIDLMGKTVWQVQDLASNRMDISSLAPGSYFLQLSSKDKTYQLNFVKR